jgi:hypothetical protein
MTNKKKLMEEFHHQINKPYANSHSSGWYSEAYLINKKKIKQNIKINQPVWIEQSCILEKIEMHDKILSDGFIDISNNLKTNAQKFGAKSDRQKLKKTTKGSLIDPNHFINYLDTKFYTFLNL